MKRGWYFIRKFLRINQRIKGHEVRVIDDSGEQLGVMPTREAINLAKEKDFDLVEVAPGEKPPVCKIMDYGKYKYKLNKKAHDAKKKQKVFHLKEVKLRPKTEEHDYQFKLKHVNRFLANGDKAKITIMFRGREIVHSSIGQAILERMVKETKDVADVEQFPKREGRNMTLILSPKLNK